MIPKKIHYCWFGGKPLPAEAQKCIESWRKYLPDYEIIEWNERNFDINNIPFTYQAYKLKLWAFLSDYARFWILYHYGGIYFDIDVEVIKDLTPILSCGAFMGNEKFMDEDNLRIATGLGLAFDKGNEFLSDVLDYYSSYDLHFHKDIPETVVDIITNMLLDRGAINSSEILQECNGITLYPTRYFCPLSFCSRKLNITSDTYTIHHYNGSWSKLFKIPFKIDSIITHRFHTQKYHVYAKLMNIYIRLLRHIWWLKKKLKLF